WYWPFGLLYLAYCFCSFASFFIHNAVSPVLYILSLHDALPIFSPAGRPGRLLLWLPAGLLAGGMRPAWLRPRSPALREGWRAAVSVRAGSAGLFLPALRPPFLLSAGACGARLSRPGRWGACWPLAWRPGWLFGWAGRCLSG